MGSQRRRVDVVLIPDADEERLTLSSVDHAWGGSDSIAHRVLPRATAAVAAHDGRVREFLKSTVLPCSCSCLSSFLHVTSIDALAGISQHDSSRKRMDVP